MTIAATVLLAGSADAREARQQIDLSLPIVVEPVVSPAVAQEIGFGTLFGAQPARYRSIARLEGELRLPNGALALPAGSHLYEHVADGAFKGSAYCRLSRVNEINALFCLTDADRDGAFETLWLGRAVIGRADVMMPAVPNPQAARADLPFTPIRYLVASPAPDDALRIGFYISGSNPFLGQHHFYQAISGPSGDAPNPLLATHKAVRLSDTLRDIAIGGATIQARKLGKNRYEVGVVTPLAPGERSLVEPYPVVQRMIFVPG